MAYQLLINGNDYSKYVYEPAPQITWGLNEMQLLNVQIASEDPTFGGFGVPARDSSILLHTSKFGNNTFKGSVTSYPEAQLIGYKRSPDTHLFFFKIQAASEERQLIDMSRRLSLLPSLAGRLSGDIIKIITTFLLPGKFDYTNIAAGSYQPDFAISPGDSWQDIVKRLAQNDGFHYWVLNGQIFYQRLGDSSLGFSYDPSSNDVVTGWNASNLVISPKVSPVKNDIIVVGSDAPKGKGRFHTVGDGYTGTWGLQSQAFGIERYIIRDDSWSNTGNIDTNVWEVQDPTNALQPTQPNLQMLGGGGIANSYVRMLRALELAGSLRLIHGEAQITGASDGIIGGIYKDFSSTALANLLCGFQLTKSGENLLAQSKSVGTSPWGHNAGTETFTLNATAAPDGSVTATQIVTAGGEGGAFQVSSVSSQTGQKATFSLWLKSSSGTPTILLQIGRGSNLDMESASVTINTTWTRYTFTHSGTWSGSQAFLVIVTDNGPATTFFCWGAQLNRGSIAQRLTPTTTVAIDLGTTDIQPVAPNGAIVENRFIQCNNFNNAAWTVLLVGTATTPTITPNAVLSPDGTQTATKIVFPSTDASSSSRLNQLLNIPSPIPGDVYCFSLWLRADSAQTVFIFLKKTNAGGIGVGGATTCNVTTAWQQFFMTGDASVDTTTVLAGVVSQLTSSPGATVYAWGAVMNLGVAPAPTQLTTTVALTAQKVTTNNQGFGHNYVLITRIHGYKQVPFQVRRSAMGIPNTDFGGLTLQDKVRFTFEVWDYTITPLQANNSLDPVITKLGEFDTDISALLSPYVAYVVMAANDLHLALNFTELSKPMQAHLQTSKPVLDANGIPIGNSIALQRSLGFGLDRSEATINSDQNGHQLQFFNQPIENIPVAGEKVELFYVVNGQALARVSDATSIAAVAAKYGAPDNGIRTLVVMDSNPEPHSDPDALSLASALLKDNVLVGYSGNYQINSNYTSARPVPGRFFHVADTRLEDSPRDFLVNSVQHDISGDWLTLADNHNITIEFGDVARVDALEKLLRLKQRSRFLDGKDIAKTVEIDILGVNATYLKDEVTDWDLSVISSTQFQMQVKAALGTNSSLFLEARRWDRGWGQENIVSYAGKTLTPNNLPTTVGVLNDGGLVTTASILSSGALVGGWFSIDFGIPTAIQEWKYFFTANANNGVYNIQYSDDNSSWTSASANWTPQGTGWQSAWWYSVGAHRYWRILIVTLPTTTTTISELVVCSSALDNIVSRTTNAGQTQLLFPRGSRRQLFYVKYWKYTGDNLGTRIYSQHSALVNISYPLVPIQVTGASATFLSLRSVNINYTIPQTNFQDIWRVIVKRHSNGEILDNYIWRADTFVVTNRVVTTATDLPRSGESVDIITYNVLGEAGTTTNISVTVPSPTVSAPSINEGLNLIEWTLTNAGSGVIDHYHVQIASDSGFVTILVDDTTKDIMYRYDLNFTDTRFIRISVADSFGEGAFSTTLSYSISAGAVWVKPRGNVGHITMDSPYNGDFEQWLDALIPNAQIADGWTQFLGEATGAGILLNRSIVPFAGNYAQSIQNNGGTGGGAIGSRPFPVTPSMIYQTSIRVKVAVASTASLYFRVLWYSDDSDFSATLTTRVGFTLVPPQIRFDDVVAGVTFANTVFNLVSGNVTAPANAKFCRILLYNWTEHGAGTLTIDTVKFEPVFDGPGDAILFEGSFHDVLPNFGTPQVVPDVNLIPAGIREAFASWNHQSNIVVTDNSIVDPLGNANFASKFVASAAGFNSQTILSLVSGSVYTFSVWLKVPSGTQTVTIKLTNFGVSDVAINNATITTTWQRFTVTGTLTTTSVDCAITLASAFEVHVWGAQLDHAGSATTYVSSRLAWVQNAIRGKWATQLYASNGGGNPVIAITNGAGIKYIVVSGDIFRLYIQILDNVPTEIMIQMHSSVTNTWGRVYWGASELFGFGTSTQVATSVPPIIGSFIELTWTAAQAGFSGGECIDNLAFDLYKSSGVSTVIFSDLIVNNSQFTLERRPITSPLLSSSLGRQASILPGQQPNWSFSSVFGGVTSTGIWSASAKNCTRSDGSFIPFGGGSFTWTGLAAGGTFKWYPYWDFGFAGRLAGVHFASSSTPSPTAPDIDPNATPLTVASDNAAMNQNTDGRQALTDGALTGTTATGGGGGSGSGGTDACIEEQEIVCILRGHNIMEAKELYIPIGETKLGDYIKGWDFEHKCMTFRPIIYWERVYNARWVDANGHLMTPLEEILFKDIWKNAYTIAQKFVTKISYKINIGVLGTKEDDHNFFLFRKGYKPLLVHNMLARS